MAPNQEKKTKDKESLEQRMNEVIRKSQEESVKSKRSNLGIRYYNMMSDTYNNSEDESK